MLRITQLLNVLPHNPQCFQTVRWKRKPIWMGTAKSKIFRVPARKVYPVEENKEVLRLYNNYRTQMKSIRNFLHLTYNVSLQAKADTEQLQRDFEEDLARCVALNEKWNEEVRVQREARVAKQLEEDIAFAKNRKEEILRQRLESLEKAEELIRKEKQAAASFIKREDLDDAIEKAINNTVDYNFAIDLDGNKIIGRESKPQAKESVQS